MLTAGALPLLAFILLPAFSNWSSRPDTDDIRTGYRQGENIRGMKNKLEKNILDGAEETSPPMPRTADGTALPALGLIDKE